MIIKANTENTTPLRAGFNSLVPDPDKWLQFDLDQRVSQALRSKAITHHHHWQGWSAMLVKLHLKTSPGR
ncbi:MAG: hypothetical protein U5L02_15955 [Rheinheimera sp.]|nr:hypothetical protein [Rheinheimera sp.]